MKRRPAAGLGLALALAACMPKPTDPFEAYIGREVGFIRTGVDVRAECETTALALERADLHVVVRKERDGVCALGAAQAQFARTAVRVLTFRGVVEAEDAERADPFSPGRVHLLEDLPRELDAHPLVGWVRVGPGATHGCAELRVIDAAGRAVEVQVQALALLDVGCLAGLEKQGRDLVGTIAWPSLSASSTPAVPIPLSPKTGKLDSTQPTRKLVLAEREGFIQAARGERLQQLEQLGLFVDRHPIAVELAALAALSGESVAAQLATYAEAAGAPDRPADTQLWRYTQDLIERGWTLPPPACEDLPEGAAAGCIIAPDSMPEPPAADVLQDAVHGQEAQKEDSHPR